jgi:ABC-type transport system involved in multi-copper enzyme maturation permease subunit
MYWLRVLSAAIGLITLAILFLDPVQVGRSLGATLFYALDRALFFTILIIGPLMTADCIAEEKREGTLGLLFLTPLTARDIIISKVVIHGLRAFCLVLAMLPLMALPVVFGGVELGLFIDAVSRDIAALLVGLMAGISSSVLHSDWPTAAVRSVIVSAVVSIFLSAFPGVAVLMLTGILLLGVIQSSSRTLRQRVQLEPELDEVAPWVKMLAQDQGVQNLLKWDTTRARSRNPIAWLQEYSWTARLAKWGWCVIALVGEAIILARDHERGAQLVLGVLVALGISFTAANSFRSERVTGALELLLITPLRAPQIIFGRLWGLWVHFFPAVMITIFVWKANPFLDLSRPVHALMLLGCYLFVPALGLYISLHSLNFFVAWGLIFLGGCLAPYFLAHYLTGSLLATPTTYLGLTVQVILGLAFTFLLYRKVQTRAFPLAFRAS